MINKTDYETLGKEKVRETIDGMEPSIIGNTLGISSEFTMGGLSVLYGIKECDPYLLSGGVALISDTAYRLYRVAKVEKYGKKLKGYFKEILGKDQE